MKYLIPILLFLVPLRAADDICSDCHEVTTGESIHADLACLDCHTELDLEAHIDEGEIPEFIVENACGGCHDEEWNEHSESVHGLKVDRVRADEADCSDCHGTHEILPSSDRASMSHPANLVDTCGKCHSNKELMERHNIAVSDPVARYKQSIHFKVLEESGYTSATCDDCHGTHTIQNLKHSRSTINFWNVAETCGKCHTEAYQDFRKSNHWIALQKGVRDAPACITCHGEHAISDPMSTESPVKKREKADHTCIRCHSDEKLTERHDLPKAVAATYRDSYHGLAVATGDEAAATCFDCHAVHAIMDKENEASTIHPANLQQTCAQCHPDATVQFAQVYTHASYMVQDWPVEDIVAKIYISLIVVVIGFMIFHNAVLLRGVILRRRKEHVTSRSDEIRRFAPAEVYQHIIILISFFTLVITGFALKFPESGWVIVLSQLGLTEAARGLIHRTAAVVMISISVLHLIYMLASRWGRGHIIEMLPRAHDVTQFVTNMKAHLRGERADIRFGFFDYTEKLEYWALIWGTFIMIITGLILWFPTSFGESTPIWLIKVAEAVHYWEAWLATLAILIWHLFFTVFHPDEYPGNNAMFFSGRMSRKMMEEKHAGFMDALEVELMAYQSGELTEKNLSPHALKELHRREWADIGND